MMTIDQKFTHAAPVTPEQSTLASLWSGISAWLKACGDSYVASAIYEDLSRLSDAELQRRGLSRENLAREVFKTCQRRN